MIKIGAEEISCNDCITLNCFVKNNCSNEWVEKISIAKQTSLYRSNQHIVQEGNQVFGLFFIQKGKVKVLSIGLGGKSQVVRLTKSGDIIGHRGFGGEIYPISAITLEESTICFINNDTIYSAFMENPKLTYELMMYYSKELRKTESKIKVHAQMNVREKVADALLGYYNLFYENGKTENIHLNRQDISDFAGINTEQLSRILSEFKSENIISVTKNEILFNNIDQLKEIIEPFGIVE